MTTSNQNVTPMLRQYQELKRQHPGTLLFFRLGDFYELFFEDAITGARELEITLTARRPVAGFARANLRAPHHVDEPVVLFEAGKLVEARLDARPDNFRRPRARPGRRVLDPEFIFQRLRIGDRQALDQVHAGRRAAPFAAGIEVGGVDDRRVAL